MTSCRFSENYKTYKLALSYMANALPLSPMVLHDQSPPLVYRRYSIYFPTFHNEH